MKKLCRSRVNKKIAGVCGGIAEYFEIDANLVRIGWVLLSLFAGSGVLAYIICMVIMPENSGLIED